MIAASVGDVLLGACSEAWPWLGVLSMVIPCVLAVSSNAAASEPPVSARALRLLELTAPAQRSKLQQPFTDDARSDWHYTPRRRTGIAFFEMNEAQRAATSSLLRAALSDGGMDKVRAIMALEIALRQIEGNPARDPDNYAVAIFGAPSPSDAWGFRLEGHHLSLHFTLQGDNFTATLPQFMGANPAAAPRDFDPGGPRRGSRVLGKPEDLARRLMSDLDAPKRASATFDARPYGDIVTRNARKLSPLAPVGIEWSALSAAQQALLLELIVTFAEHLRPELAEARLARVTGSGLESLRFGWAGSLEQGKPHYFRIQGAAFLIEFDNSGGNHIHSVWRDFQGDWGRDVLREHYAGAGGARHSH